MILASQKHTVEFLQIEKSHSFGAMRIQIMFYKPLLSSFPSGILRMRAVLLMFVVTVSASAAVHAGLLVQQQPTLFEDSSEPMVSDFGELIARGDTFTIPGDGSLVHIGSVEWWGWYELSSSTEMDFLDDFTLEIYEFENGEPKAQPMYSIHIGDIIENAVFTRAGVIRGNSGHDPYWVVANDLGTGRGLLLHRYEALFTDNPIELESGKQYLLSIVNNEADGGLYIFNDPEPPTFIGDPGMMNLPWSWARVDHEIDDQSSSWERDTGDTAWSEVSSPDPYNPDLAFSLYDCAGNVDPIVYLHGDGVYRISKLPIGDTEYNLKFKWGTPSTMSGDLEFFAGVEAAAAADAMNTGLSAQLPAPPVDTTSTNLSFPHSEAVYVVPWEIIGGDEGGAVAVQGIGPGEQFPDRAAPWFRLDTPTFIPDADSAMYADFIKLGEVVPEPIFSPVFLDIKPGSCPNPLNIKDKGVLPVAILGTEDLDVKTIDPATIRLSKEGVAGSVAPLRWSYEDVGTPLPPGGELCDCWDLNGDGYMDLSLKFKAQDVVGTLKLEGNAGTTTPLIVRGHLRGCGAIQGQDCVRIKQEKPKKQKR
jgi:hypothetical protein